jgi:hypothetical protein
LPRQKICAGGKSGIIVRLGSVKRRAVSFKLRLIRLQRRAGVFGPRNHFGSGCAGGGEFFRSLSTVSNRILSGRQRALTDGQFIPQRGHCSQISGKLVKEIIHVVHWGAILRDVHGGTFKRSS